MLFLILYSTRFICRHADSTELEDAGIEPRTVATTSALASEAQNTRLDLKHHARLDLIHHWARSHPHSARYHPPRLDLIHIRLDIIHHGARYHLHSARSHPHSARSHPHSARSYVASLQRQFRLYIPFLGIARPQPQFPHSCVLERFIYSHDQPTYFLQQNRQRQTHRGSI
jgi:hypothetical protein